jgi:TonB family protein
MSLFDKYSLTIPLLISLFLHGFVLAIGEWVGGEEGGSTPSRQPLRAEYRAPQKEEKAPPQEVEKKKERPGNTISLETSDPKYRPYFQVLREKIAQNWEEPEVSPSEPSKGSLLMEFTLEREGELRVASVVRSSGVRGLDFAAVEAVKKAAPFDPFPRKIKDKVLTIRALFVYE